MDFPQPRGFRLVSYDVCFFSYLLIFFLIFMELIFTNIMFVIKIFRFFTHIFITMYKQAFSKFFVPRRVLWEFRLVFPQIVNRNDLSICSNLCLLLDTKMSQCVQNKASRADPNQVRYRKRSKHTHPFVD